MNHHITHIKRTAVSPYPPEALFNLVNHIEDYPHFVPWCHESKIISRNDKEVEASLNVVWSGIHKSFSTRNYLYPPHRIDLTLIDGPFRQFGGHWEFTDVFVAPEQTGLQKNCKVELELEFEITGGLLDKLLLQPIFNHIANSLVDIFCERAVEVYGTKAFDTT